MFDHLQLEDLWEVWVPRIAVTVVIMVAWDYLQRPPRPQITPAPPSVLRYDTIEETVPLQEVLGKNRLLDQLDQQRQQLQEQERLSEESDEKAATERNAEKDRTVEKKPKASKASSQHRSAAQTPVITSSARDNSPPAISAKTNHHPGMAGFNHWYEVEASLFRLYTMGRNDDIQVVPPYIPHSYRGKVSIHLHVTNQTNTTLKVYWVDYKGKHILKGTLRPDHAWTQLTWIDHPWVFESDGNGDVQTPYLYYVPYRVIPTLPHIPTVLPEDPDVGVHKFAIVPAKPNTPFRVGVRDEVLPFPAETHFSTPLESITWTLNHMSRFWEWSDPTIELLQKYLTNIVNAPETTKFRQLRISSLKFGTVWNAPLRGLLLAVGFVEVNGYAEVGCSNEPLSRERIQDIALLSYLVAKWKKEEHKSSELTGTAIREQPHGADGFGRAGFGRPGQIDM